MANTANRTELLDSLLHNDKKRVVLGAVCGFAAGCVMLLLTTLFTPVDAGKLWWLQIAATVCHGGRATVFDPPSSILIAGALWHFGISVLLGMIFGKITTSSQLPKLAAYGLVLGGLCWLASNMFGPDIFSVAAISSVPQWTRMFLFQGFTFSLAAFMALTSKVFSK